MKKVILVDGNNLLFRSYFATSYSGSIMTNSKGFPTNAVYGFTTMINKILEEEKPEYILVAFDKGKTFRHEKYDFYKAGRNAMPEELKLQFPKAKELLDAMGIKHFEIDEYEADDIIGTLSKIVDNEDEFVATIISSDKDLLQLISDEVEVKLLKTTGFIRMNKTEFIKTYGVEPIGMIDIKALMGDSSDNIPGVKGIGEKTAIKLLSEYKSLDNIYRNIDKISGKTRDKLIEGKNDAYMSYEIATIYRDVPLDFNLYDLKYQGINKKEFINILEELEFVSLLKKYNLNNLQTNQNDDNNKIIKEDIKIVDYKEFDFNKEFSYYIEVDPRNYSKGEILGISFYNKDESSFIYKENLEDIKDIFKNSTSKYTYDVKKSIVSLAKFNIKVDNVIYDAMIGGYLLDYVVKDDISFLAKSFNYNIENYDDMFGSIKRRKTVEEDFLKEQCILKAQFIYETREQILKEIEDNNERSLFYDIEMPLSLVLADMELEGIRVDKNSLDKLSSELKTKLDNLEQEIYKDAGIEFNISSPKQLANVLFTIMGLEYPKKAKAESYSTSKEILDKIIEQSPIVSKILEYRRLAKIYNGYAEGLKPDIRDDGKIHTIYTQTLTRTGRLSSIEPNLQNIPIRDEYGRLVRKAFIPEEGCLLLSSDYSQVELRVFAHLSGVEHLKQAFIDDKDIHTKTASDIYKIAESEVTKDMRRTAKAVNFGILYGISSFGLSEDLKIDIEDAKSFLKNYLNTYPGIKEYMEKEKSLAYYNGYVTTIMNRKRVINELKSKNYMVRNQGERMALNTPIQGSAADILKKAMVELYNELKLRKLKSKILLQVHDELILNVYKEELEEVEKLVREVMEGAYTLSVPLKVDIETGKNWYEAK